MRVSDSAWRDWVSRILLAPPIFILSMISFRFFLNPVKATGVEGISVSSAQAMTHLRVSGVFTFACALILIYCVTASKRLRSGLTFVAILMSLAIVVRAYGVAVDGTPVATEMRLFIAEAVFLLLSTTGIFLQRQKAQSATERAKALRIALWIAQLFLGVAFTFGGAQKISMPLAELATHLTWVPDVPAILVRFIGLSELAGGLGLILPSVTRVKPWLTPPAGLGLLTIMVLAAGFHVSRGELVPAIPVNIVLGAAVAFVSWGRFKKAPIASRVPRTKSAAGVNVVDRAAVGYPISRS